MLQCALAALGLTLPQSRSLRHHDERQHGLVWRVRSATVVAADWVIRTLALGQRSQVSRAVRDIQEGPGKTKVQLRRKPQAGKPA